MLFVYDDTWYICILGIRAGPSAPMAEGPQFVHRCDRYTHLLVRELIKEPTVAFELNVPPVAL